MSNDNKIKHLEFIQNIVTRLSGNSFMIKGWSVSIVLAGFGFFVSSKNISLLFLSSFGALVFWVLDAYYLWQEKLYRKLYENLIAKNRTRNSILGDYNLDVSAIKADSVSFFSAMFSLPLVLIYLSLIILSGVLFYFR